MAKDTGLPVRTFTVDAFPNWERPLPVSCFSINDERFYEPESSNLRYLKVPQKFPINLNVRLETVNRKPEYDEGLDYLVEHILNSYTSITTAIDKRIAISDDSLKRQEMPLFPVEFVTWRGLLSLIMRTPFEFGADWIIHVTRFKGTHYLCERDTEAASPNSRNVTQQEKCLQSMISKFKQHCLAKSPQHEPDTNVPVDECSEFDCVFFTRIEGLNLLYAAEMDGIRSEGEVNVDADLLSGNFDFVEFKIGARHLSAKLMHEFQCSLTRNWWCSSFLVGIKNLIIGLRDEEGLVKSIEEYEVNQLPKQMKNWSPNQCAQFLVTFLNCVKTLMSDVDCPYTVYEFRFDAKTSLITYEVFKGFTLKTILPDYYIRFVEERTLKGES